MDSVPTQADVVVIGGGIVGSATAYNLAKRGASVVLVEKGDIAGEQSGRNWGWVSQLRNPAEAPLHNLSLSLWPTLTEELNADIEWVQQGSMYLGENAKEFKHLKHAAKVMQSVGTDAYALTRGEVQAMIPEIAGDWYGAYYTSTNGHADPVKTTTAFARAAQELGVKVFTGCAAENILVSGGRIIGVSTELGYIKTPTVVCAAGAWASKLGRMVGLDLPQRAVRATVAATNPVPMFTQINVWGGGVAVRQRNDGSLVIAGDGTADYDITLDSFRNLRMFLPDYRSNWRRIRLHFGTEFFRDIGRRMPKSAAKEHPFAHTVAIEPKPSARKLRDGLNALVNLYPHLQGKVTIERAWAGYIDGTPDRTPVIGAVPGVKGFIFATGFSGHGFMMGPGAGLVTSQIVLDGEPSVDISAMRYTRFAEGDLNPEL